MWRPCLLTAFAIINCDYPQRGDKAELTGMVGYVAYLSKHSYPSQYQLGWTYSNFVNLRPTVKNCNILDAVLPIHKTANNTATDLLAECLQIKLTVSVGNHVNAQLSLSEPSKIVWKWLKNLIYLHFAHFLHITFTYKYTILHAT